MKTKAVYIVSKNNAPPPSSSNSNNSGARRSSIGDAHAATDALYDDLHGGGSAFERFKGKSSVYVTQSFISLLHDEYLRDVLKRFMRASHSEQHLLFWEDVQSEFCLLCV
jgi:hypothetical protein